MPCSHIWRHPIPCSWTHSISNWESLCSQRFVFYVLFAASFDRLAGSVPSLPSPLPNYTQGAPMALLSHSAFAGKINTAFASSRTQVCHDVDDKETHASLFRTQKRQQRSSRKGKDHCLTQSTRSPQLGEISGHYLVSQGVLHLCHSQEIIIFFKLRYSWFSLLASGLQQSELDIYIYIFSFFPHIDYYRTLSRPPRLIQ